MKNLNKLFITLALTGLSIGAAKAQTWNIGSPTAASVTATFSSGSGTLTIRGTGAMQDFKRGQAPWYSVRTSITKLVIQYGVTNIGNYAFESCLEIAGSLTIPNSVTSIGHFAFWSCHKITGTLTIPNTVTSIGENAFSGCFNITGSLTIPNSVTSIGRYAFYRCYKITGTLTLSNLLTSIEEGTFRECSGLTGRLIIPDLVTSIGSDAFGSCNFIAVTIPKSITSIGYCAFSCSRLTSITCLNPKPTTIYMGSTPNEGWGVFQDVNTTDCVLRVPFGSTAAYKATAQWSKFTQVSELRPSVENRGETIIIKK